MLCSVCTVILTTPAFVWSCGQSKLKCLNLKSDLSELHLYAEQIDHYAPSLSSIEKNIWFLTSIDLYIIYDRGTAAIVYLRHVTSYVSADSFSIEISLS